MERVGNVWRVKPAKAERRHAGVWHEIEILLRDGGVRTCMIYACREPVFSHIDVEDYSRLVEGFNVDSAAARWEQEMAVLLEYPNVDGDTSWPERLREVWSL